MSTAAAADAGAPKKGSKKLIVIIAALALVLVAGGGGALLLMKKNAHAEAEDADAEDAPATMAKHDPKAVPTFVALEPFTVNLADRDAERYAQIGITLELQDAKIGDQIKVFMPAIRNNILMALADKTAAQLMDRGGKVKLADQVRRETSRALGYEIEPPEDEAAADADEDKPKKKKKKKKKEQMLPVSAVHFSNFIIQ